MNIKTFTATRYRDPLMFTNVSIISAHSSFILFYNYKHLRWYKARRLPEETETARHQFLVKLQKLAAGYDN